MSQRIRIVILALLFLTAPAVLHAQQQESLWKSYADTLRWQPGDTLQLSHQFVQEGSLSLETADPTLRPVIDSVDLRRGRVQLSSAEGAPTDSLTATIVARYRALPWSFPERFRRRMLVLRHDSTLGDSIQVAAPSQPLNMESIFGTELEKSGYIGRGFTVGSNRDLSINSGFRLQMSGKLSDDITITGALTDENTPIQPEGNTRTIQELDRVYINIAGRDMSATLGDFHLSYDNTEFGRYNRKLSGVLGEARHGTAHGAVSFATLNGTYHSLQFNGLDGVQGPYRLTGRNGEQPVLVLAGTEKVFVDGVEMIRGENNDYTIEYASGEITFTPKRLITAYSRVTVDYEYAEREYVRSMLTADVSSTLFDERLRIGARYIREADDDESPIDLDFDDDDRALLGTAGDDEQRASRSGITWVGIDTARGTGAGQYMRVDSVIDGSDYAVYRYAPGTDSATYVLSFSFVGAGRGDYSRQTVGTFVFAGPGRGDYSPLRLLPLPRLHQLMDVHFTAQPLERLSISAEIGVSDIDMNRLSDFDDGDNTGAAYRFALNWKPETRRFGSFDVFARWRETEARFSPIDRINTIEFNRKWDLQSATSETERIAEGGAAWKPWSHTQFRTSAGSMQRGAFSSLRVDGGVTVAPGRQDSALPALKYTLEYIDSDDGNTSLRGSWLRQLGEATYQTDFVQPRLRVEQERRRSTLQDSLLPNSLGFVDIRPGVSFPEFWNMRFSADVGVRIEDGMLTGNLQRQSTDLLQIYGWELKPWQDLRSSVSVTIRDRRYSDAFQDAGNKDLQTVLTRAQTRYAPLNGGLQTDLLYEVSTERTSRLQRVFLNVPYGQGNYEYLGDLNENGVQDEEEFELTRYEGDYVLLTLPTDELFPVIDLKSSLRVRLRPYRFIKDEARMPVWKSVLRAFSTESFVRIDEKSEAEGTSDIYLLKLSRFLNDSTTLRGFQNLRQDVFLFERSPAFSLRFRFDERRGFSQFALSDERSYRRERSLRAKTQLVREIGLQTDLIFMDDHVSSTVYSSRARDITSSNLIADLSYRPWSNLEIGFVLDTKSATDSYPEEAIEASITSLTLRSIASFDGPGRLRAEIERNDVSFNTEVERFPFELTGGRAEGLGWVWRLHFDYRITSFMQATVSYLGRSESERDTIHIARAEVKAFF